MYSHEDRLRAVKLYLKLGRRMNATLRQLGYSNKNSLKAWSAEFEQHRDLRKGYQRVKRRYTDEQKHRAVDHYVEQGHSLIHTIRCLGYPSRETLRAWIGELRPEFKRTITGSSTPHNMPRPRATKQQAIIALNTRSGSAREVADTIGVTRETLYSWHHQLLGYAPLKPMPKRTDTVPLEQQRADLHRELIDLEAQVRKLRLERDILEKASELIRKDAGINLLGLTSREKATVVDALKELYPLTQL